MHESEQLLPEERGDEQLPRPPFAGADTGHEVAAFTLPKYGIVLTKKEIFEGGERSGAL